VFFSFTSNRNVLLPHYSSTQLHTSATFLFPLAITTGPTSRTSVIPGRREDFAAALYNDDHRSAPIVTVGDSYTGTQLQAVHRTATGLKQKPYLDNGARYKPTATSTDKH